MKLKIIAAIFALEVEDNNLALVKQVCRIRRELRLASEE